MVVNGETEPLTAFIGETTSVNLGGFIATLGGFAEPSTLAQATTSSQSGTGVNSVTNEAQNATLQMNEGSRRTRMNNVHVLGIVGIVIVGIGWV